MYIITIVMYYCYQGKLQLHGGLEMLASSYKSIRIFTNCDKASLKRTLI